MWLAVHNYVKHKFEVEGITIPCEDQIMAVDTGEIFQMGTFVLDQGSHGLGKHDHRPHTSPSLLDLKHMFTNSLCLDMVVLGYHHAAKRSIPYQTIEYKLNEEYKPWGESSSYSAWTVQQISNYSDHMLSGHKRHTHTKNSAGDRDGYIRAGFKMAPWTPSGMFTEQWSRIASSDTNFAM